VDIWLMLIVSVFLLAFAVGLLIPQVRAWRKLPDLEMPQEERDFRRRQLRRRIQTSAMMALLAIAIGVGTLLTSPPLAVLLYWGGVLLLLMWIGLLAAVDIWATRHYYGRLRHDYLLEKAKLEAQLRRLQSARGNGEADQNRPDSET
jgi:hypothetical protein